MIPIRTTTPTGIPIRPCDQCGRAHPVTRRHCPGCGRATIFRHGDCHPTPTPADGDQGVLDLAGLGGDPP